MRDTIRIEGFPRLACKCGLPVILTFLPVAFQQTATAQVTFEAKTEPAGLFATTSQTLSTGAEVETRTPALNVNGYAFTHWMINGTRRNDANGQALNRVSLSMQANTVAIAHYLDETIDSDADGIPDWHEVRVLGTLDRNASHDGDGDGFGIAEELQYGSGSTVKDEIAEGGVSIRRTTKVFMNFSGANRITVSSDPPGLVSSSDAYQDLNSTFTSANLSGASNGYVFSHWEVNGVRRADAGGVGLNKITETMSEDKHLVAKYYPQDKDSDKDDIPDWYEWREFGNLDKNGSTDPDGDGFNLAEEAKFGLAPNVPDEIAEGGVSIRRAGMVFMNFSDAKRLTVSSDPPGLVSSSNAYQDLNSTFTSANLSGAKKGFVFSHWEVNGIRRADAGGVGLNRITETISENKDMVAKYFRHDEDSDKDGIPDWYEWHKFGDLDKAGADDPDGDGFTLAEEAKFGLSPTVPENILEGGVSIRRALQLTFTQASVDANGTLDSDGDGLTDAQELALGLDPNKSDTDGDGFADGIEVTEGSNANNSTSLANYTPTNLELNGTFVDENQTAGTVVGTFSVTDPDANSIHVIAFAEGNGSTHNQFFAIDANGTLRTVLILDHETNATLSIRARARDEYNASIEKAFVITVANIVEDLDGDGIEDHFDPDGDGDGFSDIAEMTYGSDPRNSESVANQAPTLLDLIGSSVEENQASGTMVGKLNPTDPDANATITLAFSDGNGSESNHLFSLDANGTLRTNATFDYETNATTMRIRAKATDEHNASLEKTFVVNITNIFEDLDSDGIEDHFDPDDDGDGFSDIVEIAYGSKPRNSNSVANQAPTLLDLNGSSVAENEASGTTVGKFNSTDPDANATIILTFSDGNGSQHNHLFTIDSKGTLRTTMTFDYETNVKVLSIRVRATDEHNAWLEKSFALQVTNVSEDLDADGIENHYDADDDGDGFSDMAEVNAGTNPMDFASTPNHPPSAITLNNLRVVEGRPANDWVASVQTIDPDDANGTGSYSYSLVDGNGSSGNGYFFLDELGTLRTSQVLDHESNALKTIRIRVSDEHNASLEKSFIIEVIDLQEWVQAPLTPTFPDLPDWLSDAQPVDPQAPDWYFSFWFGSFHRTTSPWLYHADLGWIFTVDDGTGNNGWLWSEGQGWLWTGQGLFRYLYRQRDQTWIYFLSHKNGQPHFYNHVTKQVE